MYKKGSATTLCDSIQEDAVEITFRHHARKVEYSSKPEGVGNSRDDPKRIYERSERAMLENKPD